MAHNQFWRNATAQLGTKGPSSRYEDFLAKRKVLIIKDYLWGVFSGSYLPT